MHSFIFYRRGKAILLIGLKSNYYKTQTSLQIHERQVQQKCRKGGISRNPGDATSQTGFPYDPRETQSEHYELKPVKAMALLTGFLHFRQKLEPVIFFLKFQN